MTEQRTFVPEKVAHKEQDLTEGRRLNSMWQLWNPEMIEYANSFRTEALEDGSWTDELQRLFERKVQMRERGRVIAGELGFDLEANAGQLIAMQSKPNPAEAERIERELRQVASRLMEEGFTFEEIQR